MKYFEEMNNKYGFEDGNCIPPDAQACREVYVKVLNKLLKKNESNCRIVPFDRSGVHNWCLYLRVSIEKYLNTNLNDFDGEECEEDAGWTQSVEDAYEMCLDDYVETKVVVLEEDLQELLVEIGETNVIGNTI